MKTCSCCGERKPLEAFTPDTRRADGRYSRCRECFNAAARERAAAQPRRVPSERTKPCVDCGVEIRFMAGARGGRPPDRCEPCKLRKKRETQRTTRQRNRPERLAYMRERKQRRRLMLDDYKRERGCLDCGTKEGLLELDHRPGTVKRFNPGRGIGYSLAVLWAEVAKCDVRCGACHRRRHLALRATPMGDLGRAARYAKPAAGAA